LSTGAVTGVIDRLERSGFVRRIRDPRDRRKVLVETAEFDEERFASLFRPAVEATERVLARFSPAERDIIERYQNALLEEMRSAPL
jgi:DNA-binding MarR family transcriptional regulator